ncbi:hypothetical protein C474_18980 [Halogeometricum pallidum JCM 14848]|uniref:Uncharacterized protein n=1 Tax=Halogeometricum pallidum JCM 14848 TaxID=1227487 RepID=M0CU26_HALPD|nr:hypothetical protein [Halogeometricum pallidum]ELZ26755.1 hypothetical protein C474_18980 [Halogeometricum pallidum JCM 14848]
MSDETRENPDDDYGNPSEEFESDHDQYAEAHHSSDPGRVTAPMQEFSAGKAATGFVVLVVGLAVIFGLPFLL